MCDVNQQRGAEHFPPAGLSDGRDALIALIYF